MPLHNITEHNITEQESIEGTDVPSVDPPKTAERPKAEDVNWVMEKFNRMCPDYPKAVSLSDKRKNKIRLRLEEMRKVDPASDILGTVFLKMQNSKFLKGGNHRGWKASFDWIFENATNWVKIYEGNFDDRKGKNDPDNKNVNNIWE